MYIYVCILKLHYVTTTTTLFYEQNSVIVTSIDSILRITTRTRSNINVKIRDAIVFLTLMVCQFGEAVFQKWTLSAKWLIP